jgi:hypothetical protein
MENILGLLYRKPSNCKPIAVAAFYHSNGVTRN